MKNDFLMDLKNLYIKNEIGMKFNAIGAKTPSLPPLPLQGGLGWNWHLYNALLD